MFNIPIQDIDFQRVKEFCQQWPEGVRVEYKAELNRNIPKLISSLANTAGGIALFGVEIDTTTNMPIFPIKGMELENGFEERITQACINGVYPPITPSVKIIPIPSSPGRAIGVVQVSESLNAPHAIENTTRIYIRVNSTSDPVELANINRIEYLLTRRNESEQRRETLVKNAFRKFEFHGIRRLKILIGPLYPHRHILPQAILDEKVEVLKRDHKISYLVERFRRCQDGYMSAKSNSSEAGLYHFAISFYGFLTYIENLELGSVSSPRDGGEPIYAIELKKILIIIFHLIKAAEILLKQGETINLVLRVQLENLFNTAIYPDDNLSSKYHWLAEHRVSSSDDRLSAEVYLPMEDLSNENTLNIIMDLMKQLMWGFNWSDDFLTTRIKEILMANGLVRA